MFHCVIPTVSKNITLWKLSDVQLLINVAKINHFWKFEKFVIFVQNKPVLKGLKGFFEIIANSTGLRLKDNLDNGLNNCNETLSCEVTGGPSSLF